MTEEEVERIKSDLVAASLERDELRAQNELLSRRFSAVLSRLDSIERRVSGAETRADELEDDIEDLESQAAAGGGGGSGGDGGDEGEIDSEGWGDEPHAFKVVVSGEKVLCYLPKGDDGTYFPAAMGGKHLGASTGTTAEDESAPFGDGTNIFGTGSVDMSWARFGWYELEDTLDLSDEAPTNDKLVVATFSVPRDPPEDERDDDTEVEGPKLTGIELMDAEDWQDHAEQTWKEFDPGGSAPLTREVVIAHIANGLVTQITMTPFLSPGDGGADDWHADSEGGVNFSIDPVSRVPEYETEDESVDVPTYKTVIGLDGKPTKVQTGTKTVTRQKVKLDGNGQPIAKQAQQLDENGDPAVDGQGNPIMGPCFTETLYHQVHNFDSGNDNGLVELADENNYGGTQVACRIPGAGGAELFWRRIPRSPGQPCPPSYELDEQAGSGCTEKTIVLKKTEYTPNSSGGCDPGTPTIVGGGIAIPKPPEYSLGGADASSGCATTVTLYKTPCGGTAGPVGSVDIPKPRSYTISSGGSSGCVERSYKLMETNCSGSSPVGASIDIPKPPEYALTVSGGSCSKMVSLTKTPCGGSGGTAVGDSFTFDVPPTISATSTGNSSGGALAGTVTVTPCGGTAVPINIYNGPQGPGGTVCGSFPGLAGVEVSTGTGGKTFLKFNIKTYTFQKQAGGSCYEPVAGADNWVETLEIRSCP